MLKFSFHYPTLEFFTNELMTVFKIFLMMMSSRNCNLLFLLFLFRKEDLYFARIITFKLFKDSDKLKLRNNEVN